MAAAGIGLVELEGDAREVAVPVLRESFTGYYRWHAKRALREVTTVRGAIAAGEIAGVALLDELIPEVGYVYYLAVRPENRRHGIGAALLDDALGHFQRSGSEVVYAAVETENVASAALFRTRGFRLVERKERGFREGGLGAWGLRSRMRIVSGEMLLGLRLRSSTSPYRRAIDVLGHNTVPDSAVGLIWGR